MAIKSTPRLTASRAQIDGLRSTDPAVQAMLDATRRKREEEEKKRREAAQAVSSSGSVGLNRAAAALPGAARLSSTDPVIQQLLDNKAKHDATLAAWDAQRGARQEAYKKDLQAAGGYYATLPQKSDWAAYSAAREDVHDPTYRYINDPEGYGREYDLAAEGKSNLSGLRTLTDDERKTYTYLYNKNIGNAVGKNVAKEYLDSVMKTKSGELAKQSEEYNRRLAKEMPRLSSALSPVASVLGGALSAADLTAQGVKKIFTGEDIDYNSRAQQIGKSTETIRNKVAENIDSPVWKFLYQTGMSAADSLAAGVVGPLAGGWMLGTSAGASAARDAHERGASDEQALLVGVLAGTAEGLFERVSIGNLRGLKDVPVTGIKSIAKNVAKSMAVNASEEALTEIANTVTDLLVMGDMSNYALMVEDYLAQDIPESEAKKKAAWDVAEQILMSGLSGAVMGTAFGGIGSVQSAFQNSRTGKAIAQTGNPQTVLDAGMGMAEGSDARKFAERLTAKQEAGQALRNSEIGALHRENVMQIKNAQDTVTRLGKAFGRQVHFYEDADAEQGGYAENGEIYLNTRAPKRMMAQFFTHELTHTAENAEAYNLLADDIRGRLGDSLEEMKQRKIERYAQKGTALTDAGAEAEVIADYVAKNLFTNEAEITQLAKRNRNAALRVYDRIREWSAKVTGDSEKEFLLRAQRLYEKALQETRGTAGESVKQYSLDTYSEKQIENWSASKKIQIYSDEEQLRNFVRKSLTDSQFDKKMYFGKVSGELADRIYEDTGVDVRGYNLSIASQEIRKIIKHSHGSEEFESLRGQRTMTEEDIANIPIVVTSPDKVILSSNEYNGRPAIEFHKTINGKTTVITYQSQRSHDLAVQTMYGGKEKGSLATPPSEVSLLSHTSETPSGTASNDSIAENSGSVNSEYQKYLPKPRQMAYTDESDAEMIDLYGRAMPEFVKANREAVNHEVVGVLSYAITDKDDAYLQDRFGDSLGEYAQAGSTVLGMLEDTEAFERIRDRLGDFYVFDQRFNSALGAQMLVQAKRDGYIEHGKGGTVALTEKGLEYAFGGNVPEWVSRLRQDYVKGKIRQVAKPMQPKSGTAKAGAEENQAGMPQNVSVEATDVATATTNDTPRRSKGFTDLLAYIDTIPDAEKREAARAELMAREEELDAFYRNRELEKEIKAAKGIERREEVTPEPETQKGSEATDDLLQYAEEIAEAEEVENVNDNDDWYSESLDENKISRDVQKDMEVVENLLQQRDIETEYSRRHTEEQISVNSKKEKKPLRQRAEEAKSYFIRKMVDSGEAVDRLGKAMNDKSLYHYYNMARASSNAGVSMIVDAQTDIYGEKVGKSLNDIFKPIRDQGADYYTKFQLFLYHRHNIDRMSRVERAQSSIKEAQDAVNQFNQSFPYYSMMTMDQVRKIAESYSDPEAPLAQEYLKLNHVLKKAQNIEDKPVFGFDVSAEDSRREVERLLQENPEFEKRAEEVYQYSDNLMQYRVDSGLVSADFMLKLKQIYPHYVPTFRVLEDGVVQQSKLNQVQIKKTVNKAHGGKSKLKPLHEAMAAQTINAVREGSKNRFGLRLMEDVWATKREEVNPRDVESMRRALMEWEGPVQKEVTNIEEMENTTTADTFDDAVLDRKDLVTNTFIIREGDKRWKLTVSPALYEAVDVLSPKAEEVTGITKAIRAANNLFKKMITGINPAFAVKNFLRDLQDAGLYSGSVKGFIKKYPEAWKQIAKNGDLWQQYKALGGTYSSVFDYATGTVKEEKPLYRNTLGRVEVLNMAIEQAPRFTEFLSTRERLMAERGETKASMDTLMDALYAAADITTNFGRSGTLGKTLNQNYIPFFNPSVQGFDRLARWVSSTKTGKEWARFVATAAVCGMLPSVVNALMFGDDEEWDNLNSRDKDVYYLFKVGDGTWLKLPKGRAVSLFGMAVNMAVDAAKGNDINLEERISTAASQVAPMNPLKENILKAWMDADLFDPNNPGRTWYGGQLESQRLQSYAPEDRYDEKTDELSKLIGKITKLSPKKINYLLDSYTGVLGDVLLPLLTPRAERGLFSSSFLLDSKASNRLNGEFYDRLDELTYAKNKPGSTGIDDVMFRFWNKQASAVSDINRSIREIEVDASLSDTEKRQMVRAQYDVRNAVEQNAREIYDKYCSAAEFWYSRAEGDEDDKIDYAYLMANNEVFGAEYALKTYNKNTYEKAQRLNAEGVTYEHFFYMQFTAKDAAEKAEIESNEMRSRIRDLNATSEEKKALYRGFVSTTRDDDIEAFEKAGLSFDLFLQVQNAYTRINETYNGAGDKQEAFEDWMKLQKFSKKERKVITECFTYFWSIPAEGSKSKKTDGLSLPTMPEIKLPEIKLPTLPQINLPNFGG